MAVTNPTKLALLGCGFAAREIHLPRLLELSDKFQVAAVCDVVPDRAREIAEELPNARVYSDLEQMLQSASYDALVVLTPLHTDAVEAGLAKGLDLFVEKPFCETAVDAQRLATLAQTAGRVVMVGAMRAFDPAIVYLRGALEEISPVRWVEVRDYCGSGTSAEARDYLAEPNFQAGLPASGARARNGLQTMLLEFVHDISILRSLFGREITCHNATFSADGWSAAGQLTLPGNIPCLFAVAEFGLTSADIFDVSFTFAGEKGMITASFGDANTLGGGVTTVDYVGRDRRVFKCDTYMEEWRAFSKGLDERIITVNGAYDGAFDVALCYEILEQGFEL